MASGVGYKLELGKPCPAELGQAPGHSQLALKLSFYEVSSPKANGNNTTQSCFRRQKILSQLNDRSLPTCVGKVCRWGLGQLGCIAWRNVAS